MRSVRLGGAPPLDGWRLLPQRALLHDDARTLVVADVHLGKAASFRALGVPVPGGTTAFNLAALAALLAQTAARRLVVLGDFFHAAPAHGAPQRAALAAWRAAHADVDVVLVEGNHDARAGRPDDDLGIVVVEEPWAAGGVLLGHHPTFVPGETVLAGHLHPCVRLFGRANDAVRLPCFWQRPGLVVLPAFGDFTGGATIAREPGDRVVAIADDRLFEVPASA